MDLHRNSASAVQEQDWQTAAGKLSQRIHQEAAWSPASFGLQIKDTVQVKKKIEVAWQLTADEHFAKSHHPALHPMLCSSSHQPAIDTLSLETLIFIKVDWKTEQFITKPNIR